MHYQSKQLVINSIYKVINSAPNQYAQYGYGYNAQPANNISHQVFITWVNYVYQILDISYDYTKFDLIILTKSRIYQIANQSGIPYIYLVSQINNELLNLIQIISQY